MVFTESFLFRIVKSQDPLYMCNLFLTPARVLLQSSAQYISLTKGMQQYAKLPYSRSCSTQNYFSNLKSSWRSHMCRIKCRVHFLFASLVAFLMSAFYTVFSYTRTRCAFCGGFLCRRLMLAGKTNVMFRSLLPRFESTRFLSNLD